MSHDQEREREMVQELEAREEGNLEIKETFSSLKEEVESRTKKLNKVCVLCVCVRDEGVFPPS